MPDEPANDEVSVSSIRSRVIETAMESLATAGGDLSPEFLAELRGLLSETKPPKADAFVALFEKHVERKS